LIESIVAIPQTNPRDAPKPMVKHPMMEIDVFVISELSL
jgi:hypothetical protein